MLWPKSTRSRCSGCRPYKARSERPCENVASDGYAEEFQRFTELNDAYKAKFAFPFIMAVKGSNRHQILAAFEERIHNSKEAEFTRALAEINKIALFRLQAL